MFNKSKFNRDISNWDVKSVTDMSGMFSFSKFNIDISEWDVSNVENDESFCENTPQWTEPKPNLSLTGN